jgi:galactosyl transferase GMA12/MNN10 family
MAGSVLILVLLGYVYQQLMVFAGLRLTPETARQDLSDKDSSERKTTPTSKPKVALLTVAIGDQSRISLPNHREYCSKWGYHCKFPDQGLDNRHPKWQKIPHTLNLLDQGYDYVFWVDGDAFFTNCGQSLQSLTNKMEQDSSSWLFSGDTLIINSGQMMWKNTKAARDLLIGVYKLWSPEWTHFLKLDDLADNAAFAAYLAGARRPITAEILAAYKIADECYILRNQQCQHLTSGSREALHMVSKELIQHVSFVPKREINSYEDDFHKGDFIFHCAGQSNKKECMARFATKHNASLDQCPIFF